MVYQNQMCIVELAIRAVGLSQLTRVSWVKSLTQLDFLAICIVTNESGLESTHAKLDLSQKIWLKWLILTALVQGLFRFSSPRDWRRGRRCRQWTGCGPTARGPPSGRGTPANVDYKLCWEGCVNPQKIHGITQPQSSDLALWFSSSKSCSLNCNKCCDWQVVFLPLSHTVSQIQRGRIKRCSVSRKHAEIGKWKIAQTILPSVK